MRGADGPAGVRSDGGVPLPTSDQENPNRQVRIDKVVVHICAGEGGENLRKAERVLEILTSRKPVRTIARRTIRDWGVRRGMPIGCKVTLRKRDAEEFLKRALWVMNSKILRSSFDDMGNVSFGIPDYTGFEGVRYDPEIGILGLDVCITLRRNGRHVMERRVNRRRIPKRQYVTLEEALQFFRERLNIEVIE